MFEADGAPAAAAADNRHAGSIWFPPFSALYLWSQQRQTPLAHMVGALSTESYEIMSVVVAGLADNRYTAAKQALLTAY